MLSIFLSKKMPVGLPEKINELQQNWTAFLLKMEEEAREIIAAEHALSNLIQKARDAYQVILFEEYKALHAQYPDNNIATDLLDHFRDKIYHVLLQWEQRLNFLQEKFSRARHPEKKYVMVGTGDDGITFYAYYGRYLKHSGDDGFERLEGKDSFL